MKNIIFIEGVSGVGKSVTVQKLGERLSGLGYSVRCHFEGDPDGPLDLCWVAYLTVSEYENLLTSYPEFAAAFSENIIYQGGYILLRYQIGRTPLYPQEIYDELHKREFCYNPANTVPLIKFTEVFLNLWRQYAVSDEINCDYAVFDASLVSHMTSDMMRNYNASTAEMVNHLETLLQAINFLNPIVFYLSSENVRERLTKARQSRGQTPLKDRGVEFWEKRKQLDLTVLPKISVESHILDISAGNWDETIDKIAAKIVDM